MSSHSPTQVLQPATPLSPSGQRPRGILKNSNSYNNGINSPPSNHVFSQGSPIPALEDDPISLDRPGMTRELSEKELTLANTKANAGPRRASSVARSSMAGSRRQSSANRDDDENSPRLKWDEANLYLTEQDRDSTMKIDEPKTPYARQYDPTEDEDDTTAIDAQNLNVDELDMANAQRGHKKDEIPDLDIGEPEDSGTVPVDGEKRVMVDDSMMEDGLGGHGEEELSSMSAEARAKHLEFEERRKRHYEMKDVKGMLGHPEDLDEIEEER